MECVILVYNFWDAFPRSKLGGLFAPRKLCKWVGSFNTDFCCLWTYYWFGPTTEGIVFFFSKKYLILSQLWENKVLKNQDFDLVSKIQLEYFSLSG